MASPAEIVRILPDTLPEDFSEWDSENSPAALPAGRDGFEGSDGFGADSKPSPQSRQPQLTAPPNVDELLIEPPSLRPAAYTDREALGERMRAINAALKSKPLSASPAQEATCATTGDFLVPARSGWAGADAQLDAPSLLPATASADEEAFFNQLRAIGNVLNIQEFGPPQKQVHARAADEVSFKPAPSSGAVHRRWPIKPIHVTATIDVADEPRTPMFQSDLADLGDENQDRKKWTNVAVISASFLLSVFLGVWLLSPGRHTSAKPSLGPQPAVASAVPAVKRHKPSPSLAAGRLSSKAQVMAEGRRSSQVEDYLMPQADSQQVSDQLTATPRIPRDITEKVKE
jgi:hypothetical protein